MPARGEGGARSPPPYPRLLSVASSLPRPLSGLRPCSLYFLEHCSLARAPPPLSSRSPVTRRGHWAGPRPAASALSRLGFWLRWICPSPPLSTAAVLGLLICNSSVSSRGALSVLHPLIPQGSLHLSPHKYLWEKPSKYRRTWELRAYGGVCVSRSLFANIPACVIDTNTHIVCARARAGVHLSGS